MKSKDDWSAVAGLLPPALEVVRKVLLPQGRHLQHPTIILRSINVPRILRTLGGQVWSAGGGVGPPYRRATALTEGCVVVVVVVYAEAGRSHISLDISEW